MSCVQRGMDRNDDNFCPKPIRLISIHECCISPMHNYATTPYGKSSKKSRKVILRGGEDPPQGRRVTFRPLKLLRNTLKVTPRHPQSYSRIGLKFSYPAALLFYSSSSKSCILTLQKLTSTLLVCYENSSF